MRISVARLLLISTISALTLVSHAEDTPKWGSTTADATPRAPLEGTALFYNPEKVTKEAGTVSFLAYKNPTATAGDDGTEYLFNCSTHEYTTRAGGKGSWAAPTHLVSGEALYPVAHKLCDWGPGFFKKLLD